MTLTPLKTMSRPWIAVLILILIGSVLPLSADDVHLFRTEGVVGLVLPPPPDFPAAARLRPVALTPDITTSGRLAEGDRLVLDLFPGRMYTALIDSTDLNVNGTWTVRGRIEEYPFGYVLISTTGGRSLGAVRIPEKGERYIIQSEPEALTHYLIEPLADHPDEVQVGPPLIPPGPGAQEIQDIEKIAAATAAAGPQDPAQIDVMIVYTPAAREWAEASGGGIANVIAQAMAKAKLGLDNSNTFLTMFLVRSFEVNYTESGSSNTDLERLTYHAGYDPWNRDPDRYMEEVHTWRNQYGADLVSLFALVSDTGGLAWLLNSGSGRPHFGFSLTRVQQAATGYTHIHEMGHNMGCHHHKEQNVQPGPGLFGFSAGWRWVGNDALRYCSIMTYASGSYFTDGQTHTQVAHFSSPNILHQSVPTGHGTNGDNARTIREVKHAVAAYRTVPKNNLTIQAGAGGTTDPSPGTYGYIPGDSAMVTAIPDDHHVFTNWTGDAGGSTSPIHITMDRNKTVRANFRAVQAPSNASGQKVFNRSLLQGEHINVLRWQANPANQGLSIAKYRIHMRSGNTWSMLAEVDPGVFEYRHRKVDKSAGYTYAVVAVVDGRDGYPAYITIQ
ncbi:MAG: M12 family metallo-peptidase [Acidobacteriota bacterium]|nr:M12 family metallo-peptidase [Acidobacteriota bacterium]